MTLLSPEHLEAIGSIGLDQLAPATHTALALMQQQQLFAEPVPERRIFVNRNLRMEKILYVGFDLDWTLAPYDRLVIGQITFEWTLDRLIRSFGYPEILRKAQFRPEFFHRGLLIDKKAGTVFKMDRHRFVARAYLGRRLLDDAERARLYRHERLDLSSPRFYHVDTLFELPEVNVFSEAVHLLANVPPATTYAQLFADIRSAVDSIHADGTLKRLILSDPPRFLSRDPELALGLRRLAAGGRRLFLLTNSEHWYTDSLCSYLFDGIIPGVRSWKDLFSLVVVSAHKPEFFRLNRNFVELDDAGKVVGEAETPEWGKIYAEGSRAPLMRLLATPGDTILYVGDHIYQDVRWTRLSSSWRTALVLSELEHELQIQRQHRTRQTRLTALRSEVQHVGQDRDHLRDLLSLHKLLPEETRRQSAAAIASLQQNLQALIATQSALRAHAYQLQESLEALYNQTWGSVFRQGGSMSLFASRVEDFACLYTSRASNFAFYGSHHYYRVVTDPMMHELAW